MKRIICLVLSFALCYVFPIFKLISWDKRSASCRSRFIQRFPSFYLISSLVVYGEDPSVLLHEH